MRSSILTLILLALNTCCFAVEFPGTWTNGKDEFKTVSLMLRSDGQAVFATAVFPGFGLWEKTDTGLNLTLGGDGRSQIIPFTYDSSTNALKSTLQNTTIELRKISNDEPPDLLARAKEEYAERQEKWKKMSRLEDHILSNRKALHALLDSLRAETDIAKRPEAIFVAATDGQGQLTIRGLGDSRFLEIGLESRQLAKLTGFPLDSRLMPGDAISDLPLTYELPKSQREALAKLAQIPGVKSEVHAFGSVSTFKTETFHRSMQFIVEKDSKPNARVLIDQILDIIWVRAPEKIKATLQFQMPLGTESSP